MSPSNIGIVALDILVLWLPSSVCQMRRLRKSAQPCDECKKIGIAVVEVKSDADRELTGRRWLMKKEAIKKILADDSMLSSVFQKRIMFISEQP